MYLQYNTLQTGKTLHILVYERIYYLVVLIKYTLRVPKQTFLHVRKLLPAYASHQ